jgi:hypothetical protein
MWDLKKTSYLLGVPSGILSIPLTIAIWSGVSPEVIDENSAFCSVGILIPTGKLLGSSIRDSFPIHFMRVSSLTLSIPLPRL